MAFLDLNVNIHYVTLHEEALLPEAKYKHENFAVLPGSPSEDARGLHKHQQPSQRAREAFKVWVRVGKEVRTGWYLGSSLAIFKCYKKFPKVWLVQQSSGKISGSWGCSTVLKTRPEVHQLDRKTWGVQMKGQLWQQVIQWHYGHSHPGFLGKTLYPRLMLPLSHSSLLYSSTEKLVFFRISPDSSLWEGLCSPSSFVAGPIPTSLILLFILSLVQVGKD